MIEVPINELFDKTLAEHRAGTGAYDLLERGPAWIPDLARGGALEPLDAYVDKYGYRDELEDIAPVDRDNQMTYPGHDLRLPGRRRRVLLMYYRKDPSNDRQHQQAFKEDSGRDLAPPKTWEEFAEVGEYFTDATRRRRLWRRAVPPGRPGPPLLGAVPD